MTTSDAVHRAERRLGRAAVEFISALRLGHGVDESALSELKASIVELGEVSAGDDTLPKLAVNHLVGLFSWIDSASYLYGEEEGTRIRMIAGEIEQSIFRYVVPARDGDEEGTEP